MNAIETLKQLDPSKKYHWTRRHADWLYEDEIGTALGSDFILTDGGNGNLRTSRGILCYDQHDYGCLLNDGTIQVKVTTGSGNVFIDRFIPTEVNSDSEQ